jgi:cyclopropane-fatty-acyl-phospholipid synthase
MRAVRHHYDVSNEFFALFLDDSMTYSCAIFSHGAKTLGEAQEEKLETVARKLALKEGDRVLDVGCGWGALGIHAAREYGASVLGITLSPPQAEKARQRAQAAGVADRVEIRIGPAASTLGDLPERELFDFAFVDADKTGYPEYYEQLLARTRAGGLIMLDNVLAGGNVGEHSANPDDNFTAESIEAIERTNALITADQRVDTAMLSVSDGVMLARKR